MRILVIDTATKACSVALYNSDKLIASHHEVIGRGHAERLLPLIAGLPDRGKAGRIMVDVGPGSFTGIRVGVAAAKALGLAWQAEVFGYGCLALVAAMARYNNARNMPVDVVMTGGHGEYFHQFFDADGMASDAPKSLAPGLIGSVLRAKTVAGDIPLDLKNTSCFDLLPDASQWHLIADNPPLPPSPVYGRAPDAKPPKARTA